MKPEFSYQLLRVNTPTWVVRPPNVNTELTEVRKLERSQHLFRARIRRRYQNYCDVHTDSSKSEDGVGAAAAISEGMRKSASLPKKTILFSACDRPGDQNY